LASRTRVSFIKRAQRRPKFTGRAGAVPLSSRRAKFFRDSPIFLSSLEPPAQSSAQAVIFRATAL
jgi:hypothetical protein